MSIGPDAVSPFSSACSIKGIQPVGQISSHGYEGRFVLWKFTWHVLLRWTPNPHHGSVVSLLCKDAFTAEAAFWSFLALQTVTKNQASASACITCGLEIKSVGMLYGSALQTHSYVLWCFTD
jgi:hypothetical protein